MGNVLTLAGKRVMSYSWRLVHCFMGNEPTPAGEGVGQNLNYVTQCTISSGTHSGSKQVMNII